MTPGKLAALMLAVALQPAPTARGCSMVTIGETTRLPSADETWVFSGIVTGHAVESRSVLGVEGTGALIVTVDDAIQPPDLRGSVRVARLGVFTDCSPAPRTLRELDAWYPVGSRVAIVAAVIDVPERWLVADGLATVDLLPADIPRDPEGFLDFPVLRRRAGDASATDPRCCSKDVEEFELMRCLAGLERRTVRDREGLLRRIASYSGFAAPRPGGRKFYKAVLRGLGAPRRQRQELLSAFDERSEPPRAERQRVPPPGRDG